MTFTRHSALCRQMKSFGVFPGAAAHGSACFLGTPLSCVTGELWVWRTLAAQGAFPSHTPWEAESLLFLGRELRFSHCAKFLVTGLANTSPPIWLLSGTFCVISVELAASMCVSQASFPGAFLADCSTPIQVRAFARLPAPPQWWTKTFSCRCTMHLVSHISEVAHS